MPDILKTPITGSADGTPGVLLGRPDLTTPRESARRYGTEAERIIEVIVAARPVADQVDSQPSRSRIHDSRKRRRARKWISPCSV